MADKDRRNRRSMDNSVATPYKLNTPRSVPTVKEEQRVAKTSKKRQLEDNKNESTPKKRQKLDKQSEPKAHSSASKATKERHQEARITKLELAMMLAVWAEVKPDCAEQRKTLEKYDEDKRKNELIYDKRMAEVDTGATLMDSSRKIISVAGSGYTHAAAFLCSLFPTQAKGGVICVTKKPCSHCLKMMTQAGVERIVVLSPTKEKNSHLYHESEPATNHEEQPKMNHADFEKLLLSSTTAMSTFHFHSPLENSLKPKHILDKLLNLFKEEAKEDSQVKDWHTGLAILASLRSEDPTLRVGAVLAKIKDGFSVIHAVGYNGFRQQALHFDYNEANKAPFSLHAEQNLLLFRGAHDISECTLFTTHSPCYQCSCLILQHNIKDVYYADYYRAPCLIPSPKAQYHPFGIDIIQTLNDSFFENYAPILDKADTHENEKIIKAVLKHYNDEMKEKHGKHTELEFSDSQKNKGLFKKLFNFVLGLKNQRYDWNRLSYNLTATIKKLDKDKYLRLLRSCRNKAEKVNNVSAMNSFDNLLQTD